MEMFKNVLRLFFKTKGAWAFVAFSLIGFFVTTIAPYLNGRFLDFLIANKDVEQVIIFAAAIAAINISGTVLAYLSNTVNVKVVTNTAYSMLLNLVQKYEKAELAFVEKLDSSYITQRAFTDVNITSKFVIGSFLNAPLQIILSICIIAFFIFVNPVFAVLSSLLVFAYFFIFFKLKEPLYNASLQKKEADSVFFSGK